MEDFKQSEVAKEAKVGKDLERVTPSADVFIMFKQNRTYELKVGRNYYLFSGREKKKVPRTILEHPDFTPEIKKYFIIQEVS
jgi:hypothetical protein